jgi:hypothetical protein
MLGNGPSSRGGLDVGRRHEGHCGDIGVALETAQQLAFELAVFRCGHDLGQIVLKV